MKVDYADVMIGAVTGEGWTANDTGGRHRPTHDEIAKFAYQRYEANGRKHGNDIEDWLVAERELVHHYA